MRKVIVISLLTLFLADCNQDEHRIKSDSQQSKIDIIGYVNKPGRYLVSLDNTDINKIILVAGGLSSLEKKMKFKACVSISSKYPVWLSQEEWDTDLRELGVDLKRANAVEITGRIIYD